MVGYRPKWGLPTPDEPKAARSLLPFFGGWLTLGDFGCSVMGRVYVNRWPKHLPSISACETTELHLAMR